MTSYFRGKKVKYSLGTLQCWLLLGSQLTASHIVMNGDSTLLRGKIDCNINVNLVYYHFLLNTKWLALFVVLWLPHPRCGPGSVGLLLGALIVTLCRCFRLWDKAKENSYIFQVHLPNSIWRNLRYKLSVLKDSVLFCSWYLCFRKK